MKTESIFFVVPESIESNQFSSSGIKREPIDVEDENDDLNQLSTPIEFLNIKNESYDASDTTPRTADLKFFSVFIKEENYGELENFKDSSPKKCFVDSDNIFCDICGKNFCFLRNLKRHIKEVHENNNEYSCRICNKKFFREEFLVHLKVKNFKCTQCDKSFATKRVLKVHEKSIHMNIRNWKCNHCNKYFTTKSHLKVHENSVHLKIRDWKCNFCDKHVTTKSNLKTHENEVHLKIRKWKCNICEKSFLRKDSLKSHSKVHLRDFSAIRN